jgi:hypothetical protein
MVETTPTGRSRQGASGGVPKYLKFAGALIRSLFIVTLMAITWSLTIPLRATGFAHFSTGDFIRVVIGILICIGMTIELLRQPKDVEGYRTWVYIGAGVFFVWFVFAMLKWAFP